MRQQQLEQKLDERCEPVRGRPVFVDVYAATGKDGGVDFSHDWRLRETGPIKGKGPIEVPRGTPRSPIHFRLHDETGRKLKFLDDAEEAIWARVGQCPTGKGGGGQIEYDDAVSGGPTLKVKNANSEECELHYALRFKDKDGKVECYDPVIRNKGGGP